MGNLKILSLDDMCPYSDIDEGIDDSIDFDIGEGTYYKICKGELIPVAIREIGRYTDHNLLSPEEAQKMHEKNSLLEVLPVKEWYQSNRAI